MPDSSLVQFDKDLVNNIQFIVLNNINIQFQFAPKIVSDSNSSKWIEEDILGHEPLAIQAGASARQIVMEWEYVATDNKFTPETISGELRKLKGYFFDFTEAKYPLVHVKFTEVLPVLTPFRMLDINIQHGPEMVGKGNKFYPLYSKCSVTLKMATNLADSGEKPKEGAGLQSLNPLWI